MGWPVWRGFRETVLSLSGGAGKWVPLMSHMPCVCPLGSRWALLGGCAAERALSHLGRRLAAVARLVLLRRACCCRHVTWKPDAEWSLGDPWCVGNGVWGSITLVSCGACVCSPWSSLVADSDASEEPDWPWGVHQLCNHPLFSVPVGSLGTHRDVTRYARGHSWARRLSVPFFFFNICLF